MKNKLLVILLITSTALYAGDTIRQTIAISSSYFTTDPYQRVYLINTKNEIVRRDLAEGESITYSNKLLGHASFIDASNPLKVLVFYPEAQTVVTLDNYLSPLSTLKLNKASDNTQRLVTAVCREAESDRLWIYDALSRKLLRLDATGTTLNSSEPFDVLLDKNYDSISLLAADDKVYVCSTSGDIAVFDSYANLLYVLQVPASQYYQWNDKLLIGIHEGKGFFYDITTQETQTWVIPDADVIQVQVKDGVIYGRKARSVVVWRRS
ncbi:MAG: hypothetical protein R2794_00565 [Chitinophagales bacterium]